MSSPVLRLLSLSGQLLMSLITLTEKNYFLWLRNSSSVSPNIFADYQQCLLAPKKEIIGNYSIDNYSQWEPDLRQAAMLMCKQQVAKNPVFPTKSKQKVQENKNKNKKTPPKTQKVQKKSPETPTPVNWTQTFSWAL